MARGDRLFRLMHLMRVRRPPITADALAIALEVSRRTVYRDIEALRAGGAVIDGDAGFGYTLVEDTAMPPQTLDRIEAEAVVLGLATLESFGDASLTAAARSAAAKIVASLTERQQREVLHTVLLTHSFGDKPDIGIDLDMVRQACWDEQAVEIGYRDKAGAHTHRTVEPLALAYLDHALALLAWCHLRQDFRAFRIDRIETLAPTALSFRPHRARLLREHLDRLRGGA